MKRAYRVAKVIKGNLKGTNVKGKVTSRGGFRKNTVQNAWDNAKSGPSEENFVQHVIKKLR